MELNITAVLIVGGLICLMTIGMALAMCRAAGEADRRQAELTNNSLEGPEGFR